MDFHNSSPEEDWGCVAPDELFFAAGPTPSLRSLVEQFERTRCPSRKGQFINDTDTKELNQRSSSPEHNTGISKEPGASQIYIKEEPIMVMPVHKEPTCEFIGENPVLPSGILKKVATSNTDSLEKKAVSLKRVSFEIERFVAENMQSRDDRLSAEQRLVVKLGARTPRQKAVNYKQLKEQRLEMRKTQGNNPICFDQLRGPSGGKVKKKFNKNRKNHNASGHLKMKNRGPMNGKRRKNKRK